MRKGNIFLNASAIVIEDESSVSLSKEPVDLHSFHTTQICGAGKVLPQQAMEGRIGMAAPSRLLWARIAQRSLLFYTLLGTVARDSGKCTI